MTWSLTKYKQIVVDFFYKKFHNKWPCYCCCSIIINHQNVTIGRFNLKISAHLHYVYINPKWSVCFCPIWSVNSVLSIAWEVKVNKFFKCFRNGYKLYYAAFIANYLDIFVFIFDIRVHRLWLLCFLLLLLLLCCWCCD